MTYLTWKYMLTERAEHGGPWTRSGSGGVPGGRRLQLLEKSRIMIPSSTPYHLLIMFTDVMQAYLRNEALNSGLHPKSHLKKKDVTKYFVYF